VQKIACHLIIGDIQNFRTSPNLYVTLKDDMRKFACHYFFCENLHVTIFFAKICMSLFFFSNHPLHCHLLARHQKKMSLPNSDIFSFSACHFWDVTNWLYLFVVNYMAIKSIHEKVQQSQGANLANLDLSTFYFLHFLEF
jgi:hypothetical protein